MAPNRPDDRRYPCPGDRTAPVPTVAPPPADMSHLPGRSYPAKTVADLPRAPMGALLNGS
ncbi:hypothetical protein GCM10027075_15240 [Streptomyces heilongjiangensis]